MVRSLASIATQYLLKPAALKATLEFPVLVWRAAPTQPSDAGSELRWQGTNAGVGPARPELGEALVFDVRKEVGKRNAFPMGITIGRVDSNDIALDDASVSRFHAWLQQNPTGDWTLSDADSKNGTYLDGTKLLPKAKVPITDNSRLKFGEVEVVFLTVAAFIALLDNAPSGGRSLGSSG